MNYEGPKYSLGDLVVFHGDYMGELISDLGIIISQPTLIFKHMWKGEDCEEKFWTYDIKVGHSLFKMVPEAFIRRLKNEDED